MVQTKQKGPAVLSRFVWQELKDDYQTYRELNSLQGVWGNIILLEYYSRDFT